MTGPVIRIALHTLGSFSGSEWEERLEYVVGQLANEFSVDLESVRPTNGQIDVLIIWYFIEFHSDVRDHRLLEKFIGDPPISVDQLVICALGRNHRGLSVAVSEVVSAAIPQVHPTIRFVAMRLNLPDDLDEAVRENLTPIIRTRARWSRLDAGPQDIERVANSISNSGIAPQALEDI